ncbi:EIF3H factor, partial [Polypterus senegalus]
MAAGSDVITRRQRRPEVMSSGGGRKSYVVGIDVIRSDVISYHVCLIAGCSIMLEKVLLVTKLLVDGWEKLLSEDILVPFFIQGCVLRPNFQYQMEMMRSLRHVNIDHLHVGWYQSTYYGSFVSRALLDSQFSYQHAIEESVVLIYDPIKTAQGSLSLKAYRLTPKLMEICKEKDFTPEGLKKASIAYENMFEEVPIIIKNSHLINVLMWELEEKSGVSDKQELLNLSSSNHLEKSLQLLMDRVDDMTQDIVKYNTYSRNLSKQQQQKHQYSNITRNVNAIGAGEKRTTKQVILRWKKLKAKATKDLAGAENPTTGNKPFKRGEYTDIVLDIIGGDKSEALHGIDGVEVDGELTVTEEVDLVLLMKRKYLPSVSVKWLRKKVNPHRKSQLLSQNL